LSELPKRLSVVEHDEGGNVALVELHDIAIMAKRIFLDHMLQYALS
jgi:hypothetical protein